MTNKGKNYFKNFYTQKFKVNIVYFSLDVFKSVQFVSRNNRRLYLENTETCFRSSVLYNPKCQQRKKFIMNKLPKDIQTKNSVFTQFTSKPKCPNAFAFY